MKIRNGIAFILAMAAAIFFYNKIKLNFGLIVSAGKSIKVL